MQLPSTNDCLVVSESLQQLAWLNSPHLLAVLQRSCELLYGKVENLYVVCGGSYDFALSGEVEIISFQ